ncbi:MAG: DUF1993 family protein [Caulobacter sp.]|nr:DUF1993 family protein [Caulobacter sp.]
MTTFYDMSVACYLQTVGAVSGFLEVGRKHFEAAGHGLEEIVEARLHDDMLPFRFQILSVVHHSQGALDGMRGGVAGPPGASEPLDYAGLQALVADTLAKLQAADRAEIDALAGGDVVFQMGQMKLPFTNEGYLLSFSLPNLHFHATTAYDILRNKGVPLGKRHYLGHMRMKS